MEWWAEAILWIALVVLSILFVCLNKIVMDMKNQLNTMETWRIQMNSPDSDVRRIMHELRSRFGRYFLNNQLIKERVTFMPGKNECLVAEDHPIIGHPKLERLPEMGQVSLGGEQWLWCTTKSVKATLMSMYDMIV